MDKYNRMSKKSETTNSFKNDNKEKEPVLSKSLNSSLNENKENTSPDDVYEKYAFVKKNFIPTENRQQKSQKPRSYFYLEQFSLKFVDRKVSNEFVFSLNLRATSVFHPCKHVGSNCHSRKCISRRLHLCRHIRPGGKLQCKIANKY